MNRRNQQGATMWGYMAIIGMVGFIAMLAFKVVPIYFDHRLIRSAVQDIVDSREFTNMSNKSIISTVQTRLTLNNIRNVDVKSFKSKSDRSGDKFILIQYEKKVSIMSNLSALVEFNEEIRRSR
jgi:hypothetical protein